VLHEFNGYDWLLT